MSESAHTPVTVSGQERITTLSLVEEAGLTKKPPTYDPDKGIGNHKAFLRYVRSAFDGSTGATLQDAGFGEIVPGDDLSSVWHEWTSKIVAPGALTDGSMAVMEPSPAASPARRLLVDLQNRVSPSKVGERYNRYSRADSADVRNAGDLLAMRQVLSDFKSYLRQGGSDASLLDEATIEEFFTKQLGSPKRLAPKNIEHNFPLDYKRLEIISPAARTLIVEAIGVDASSVDMETISPAMRSAVIDALGLVADAPTSEDTAVTVSQVCADATPQQLAAAVAAMRASDSQIVSRHYVPLLESAMLSRSYNQFMESTMRRIMDVQQQRRYERDIADRDSATVYQQKKYVPDTHLEAAAQSVFSTSGDFSHVEVDESVELELMKQIEDEWAVLREALPHSEVKATLRFRKTGRHKAAGVYHPMKHNIAVDPRHPYSFVHEYFHHLDYTLGADADTRQLSLSESFADILHGVQANMRSTPGMDKLDYYTTPTEVFARGGELVCHWSGLATSLNGDAAKYDQPVYNAYLPYREQLIAWYNEHLDLDINHERALPAPSAEEKPQLKKLAAARASIGPVAVSESGLPSL